MSKLSHSSDYLDRHPDRSLPDDSADAAIEATNARDWQLAKEFGLRHGFGFMIQVATEEWVRVGPWTRADMAHWLRTYADGFCPSTGEHA